MKKLLVALLLTTPAFGQQPPCACWDQWLDCCGFEVSGELLFMQPSVCDLSFAVSDPRPFIEGPNAGNPQENSEEFGPIGDIQSISPDYQLGFRAAAAVLIDDCRRDIRGVYTRLHASDRERLTIPNTGGGIWAIELIESNVTDPTTPPYFQPLLFNAATPDEINTLVSTRSRFDYDAAEVQLAIRRMIGCQLWTRLYLGLHYANIDTHFDVDYEGTAHPGVAALPFEARQVFGEVRRRGSSWGLGPRLGLDVAFDIRCGIGFAGRIGMAVLAGNRDFRYFQHFASVLAGDDVGQLFEDRIWDLNSGREQFVAPQIEGRLGGKVLVQLRGCLYISVEAGYEWMSYVDMVPFGPTFRMDKGISTLECTSFNLHGLYVAVTGAF